MSQSDIILNRLCDLQETNFEVVDCQVTKEKITWWIKHKSPAIYECPRCHEKIEGCHARKWIRLKDTPFGMKECIWMVKRAQMLCTCTNHLTVEYLPFRSSHHHLTKRFVNQIEQVLCSKMFTVADVARLFAVDYGTIYKIDHDVLLRLLQQMQIPGPENISVDEKSFQKGHNYVTVVTDVDRKQAIWVSTGNKKESLDEFFQILGPERCSKIKTVSKDLHMPYALSCQQYIPQAMEVADPFHVVKKLNECLDECRKELSVESELSSSKRRKIHSLNWVLRYKQENLPEKYSENLKDLTKLNEPLYEAYLQKETFYQFFNFKPSEVKEANNFLISWIVQAFKSKLLGLRKFAEYIERNTKILLNIIITQRSSAISEGINRKITVIKAMAYGYRNIQYFKLKILQRCGVLGRYWSPAAT